MLYEFGKKSTVDAYKNMLKKSFISFVSKKQNSFQFLRIIFVNSKQQLNRLNTFH